MIKDFFKFAWTSIRHRKMRSWLTIIGILIGIAAVVSLISISQGMQEAIAGQFEMLGTDKVFIMPGGGGVFGGGFGYSSGELTDDDIDLIKDVRGVEDAVGMFVQSAKVEAGNQIKYTFVIGLPPEGDWILGDLKVDGNLIEEGDKYKAVIGYSYPQGKFFEKKIKQGSSIDISDQSFRVIGTLQEIGNPSDDSQIYIPLETARELFDEPTEISAIYVQVREGYDPVDVAEAISADMRRDRDLDKGEEDFTVQTSAQLVETMQTILGIIQIILIGVAAISLLVGGIGIMNTMYTSILERTREIGVMKAIGARNRDILLIVMIESGIFGLVGGVIGCILGALMALGVEFYAYQAGYAMLQASRNPWLIVAGMALAFFIGCVSGFMPARRAASLKPVDALRYE